MGLFDTGSGLIKDTDFLDIWGKNASADAIDAQKDAFGRTSALQWQMYQQQREDLNPWREAGTKSLEKMQGDDYMRDFTKADFEADPGYQFRMEEGQKALERSAAARGNMFGGAQAKALTKYGQGMGAQEYQASYDRFNSDRDRRFGRLATMSGSGLQAAGGMAGAAQNYGQTMNNNLIGMANAEGAAKIGASNQAAGMFGQIMGMATMSGGGGGGGKSSGGMGGGGASGPTNSGTFYNGSGNGGYSVGGANGMYGNGYSFCDERLKTDFKEVSPEQVKEFRKAFRPFLFRYISGDHGEGEFVGPMAQHLERSELGRRIVVENEKGEKMIDLGRAVMLLLAIEGAA